MSDRWNKAECQNCGKVWPVEQLAEITHGIFERVEPGDVMPAGECPECGALCQPQLPPQRIIVTVEGGLVQDVSHVPAGVEVEVRDYDCEGCDDVGRLEIDPDGNRYVSMIVGPASIAQAHSRYAAFDDLIDVANAYIELADAVVAEVRPSHDWPGLPDMLDHARAVLERALKR